MSKLLMFLYHAGQFGCGRSDSPFRIKAGNGQFLAMILIIPIVGGLTAWLTDSAGIFDFLDERWPIDYGRMHSRNYLSPWTLIILLPLVILHFSLKNFIASNVFQTQLNIFKEKIIAEKADTLLWLPPLVVLMSVLLTVFLLTMFMWGILFVFLVFVLLEIHLRKTIIKPD
ncbi:hypothetical protein ACSTDZ_18265 [Vibrio vulnificus]|uniref:hypothetical protein n=1 Tax=Vibrio vulnificus TaxID=672 RepID=UPI003EDAD953